MPEASKAEGDFGFNPPERGSKAACSSSDGNGGLALGYKAGKLTLVRQAGASSSSAGESKGSTLQPGAEVKIQGIKAKPELNGLKGTLIAFDAEKGRWQVQLPDGPPKLFKEDNLIFVPKAPPPEEIKRKPLPKTALTPEEAVVWVNTSMDEFEALMLPLQLEEDLTKIRKQYRQMSLLVHPDKNKHPDAEAAFKKMFGAMETLSDPMKQRTALRKAKRKARQVDLPEIDSDDDSPWWAEATVDEMEKKFREMEKQYESMGFFGMDKRARDRRTGVDEDLLWISVEAAKDLFDKDLALFVDSRNTTDYDVSHVEGAKCLPGHTMEQLYNIERHPVFREVTENPEQNVIVYSDNGSKLSRCTNVAGALRQNPSVQAARVLRLTGGLNQWKRMGFPVYGDARALFAGQVLGDSMGRLGGMDPMMAHMMGGR